MTELESKWKPSPDIKTHRGETIPSDLTFFTPPPQDIVNLRSASSTIQNGKIIQQTKFINKLVTGISIGFFCGLSLAAILRAAFGNSAIALISGLVVAIGLSIISIFSNLPASCSYVGDSGIANYILKKKPNPNKGIGLFLFHQAEELRVEKIQHFANGIYTMTRYSFEWKKANGETVFNINGEYHSPEDNPPPLDPYYFALAAEKAWSLFKFELLHQELKQNGKVTFNVGNKDAIVIGQGYVELIKKGKPSRLDGNEIKQVSLSQGIILIIPKEVKSSFLGFGSDGIWRIPYNTIANARIFMLIFDMLINQK
ncbi:hypothetical protein NIES267_02320 [Calothrix parasitica NIES-267]|uniref:Uncharacterized protein n=1 Tax=Calothrix parasitica NIES-267 TaxID=1973488 RepID=A0A1Z4LHR4_9CYAN|nr:hypothetical protein NIES267_02320 [Calothrix parasitica NIES-267]